MTATNTYKTFLMNGGAEGATFTKLIDIKEFPDLGQAPDTLETTTLSDHMKTYIADIIDPGGALEFNANYDLTDYETLQTHVGKQEWWAIWFGGTGQGNTLTPTGSEGKFKFKGELSVWVKGAGTSAVREMGVAITPSTPIELDEDE